MGSRSKANSRPSKVTPIGKPKPVSEKEVLAEQRAFEAYLQDIASGREGPPNEYCKFIAEQLRSAQVQQGGLRNNVQSLREQIQAKEKDLNRINGICDQYVNDLKTWVRKAFDERKADIMAQAQKGVDLEANKEASNGRDADSEGNRDRD